MRPVLDRNNYIPGRRVYVADLDVFGRIKLNSSISGQRAYDAVFIVECEAPLPGFIYPITDDNRSRLYEELPTDH